MNNPVEGVTVVTLHAVNSSDTMLVTLADGSTHTFENASHIEIERGFLSVTINEQVNAVFAPGQWAAAVWNTVAPPVATPILSGMG